MPGQQGLGQPAPGSSAKHFGVWALLGDGEFGMASWLMDQLNIVLKELTNATRRKNRVRIVHIGKEEKELLETIRLSLWKTQEKHMNNY